MSVFARAFAAAALASALGLAGPALAAKDLVVGVAANLTGLDPQNANDTLSHSAARLMMQGLFGLDKDMKLVPALAESYEANANATEFTFKLRKGVVFHDGTPFNAQAVKINFERLVNPDNKLSRASLLNMVKAFEVVDDATIKLKLDNPFGALLNNLAHPGTMIHSPAALEKFGKDVARNPVGTGPFKFVSWQADTLKVAKNDKYWKPGLPKVDGVTFRSATENGARLAMLQTGEAHYIYPMPTEMVAVVEKNPKLALETLPSIVTWYTAMNNMKKPFDNPKVRQALNYAVDKAAFAKVVFNGYAEPMDSVVPPGLPFYAKQAPWPYDLDKARALLKEAGLEAGFATDVVGGNSTASQRAMQFLQQQLAQVNVKLTVTPMEAGALTDKIWSVKTPEDATVKLGYAGWSASTGDPDWQLRPLFYGKSFPPKLYNMSYYANAEADKQIEAAIATADAGMRATAYKKAQEIIWPEAPWIYLGVEKLLAARQKNVEGVYYLADRGLLAEDADIK